ncbi:MAG TPA: hypothetical protein VGO59_06930 [Verrucomicrobiae bacterium]
MWLRKLLRRLDPPIPKRMEADTEVAMRAHLTARFGFLGAVFGIAYVVFYMAIGHTWGALIVLVCSSAFAASPFVLRRVQRVETVGHLGGVNK